MMCSILPVSCASGTLLPLLPFSVAGIKAHEAQGGCLPSCVGWELTGENGPVFMVSAFAWLPAGADAVLSPLLTALRDIPASSPISLTARKNGHSVAVITLSDKGSQGLRKDTAGPLAARMIADAIDVCLQRHFILPDDRNQLRGLLADLALTQRFDLICTCGGTGVGPRDITPQATASLLDYQLPGFGEAMRSVSLAKTPNAIISRAICGALGSCLILNLPGSARAAGENLAAILPALEHTLAKLQGSDADCGG